MNTNLNDTERRAWDAYRRTSVRLASQLNRYLARSTGLSLPDYEVLEAVATASDSRLRAYELGEELQWEKSRLSHHLKRMEQRGLIERVACESDGRGLWITLTPTGHSAFEQARPGHTADIRRLLLGLASSDQLEAITELSEKVIAGLPDDHDLCEE